MPLYRLPSPSPPPSTRRPFLPLAPSASSSRLSLRIARSFLKERKKNNERARKQREKDSCFHPERVSGKKKSSAASSRSLPKTSSKRRTLRFTAPEAAESVPLSVESPRYVELGEGRADESGTENSACLRQTAGSSFFFFLRHRTSCPPFFASPDSSPLEGPNLARPCALSIRGTSRRRLVH